MSLPEVATAAGRWPHGGDDIRRYLRARFTPRPATTDHPRYLGLVGVPYPEYGDPRIPLQVPTIPRFRVQVRGVEPLETHHVETDVPYGFLAEETVDGGDGFVDPSDLDMRTPAFVVFRIPIVQPADLTVFVDKANEFAAAEYRSDVALVAGEIGVVPGDTSVIQCLNATRLTEGGGARRVVKVFDHPTCEPDFLATNGRRLADFLADPSNGFSGGMVYNISHGTFDAIYAAQGATLNLRTTDLGRLAPGELNVFVSIACANDGRVPVMNLAMDMFLHNSVAVVSATENLFFGAAQSIIDAEVNAFQALYGSPITLLQGLHGFRSGYYEHYAIAGRVEERPYHWIDLLAVDVVGDGLAVVARAQ